MSEQTAEQKLERAIRALREIADGDLVARVEALEDLPVADVPTVALGCVQERARVCLFAIDPTYTSNGPNGIVMSGDGSMRTTADNHDPRDCDCPACRELT